MIEKMPNDRASLCISCPVKRRLGDWTGASGGWFGGTELVRNHDRRSTAISPFAVGDILDGMGTFRAPRLGSALAARRHLDPKCRWAIGAMLVDACRSQTLGKGDQ
jgi:hypothetical protein